MAATTNPSPQHPTQRMRLQPPTHQHNVTTRLARPHNCQPTATHPDPACKATNPVTVTPRHDLGITSSKREVPRKSRFPCHHKTDIPEQHFEPSLFYSYRTMACENGRAQLMRAQGDRGPSCAMRGEAGTVRPRAPLSVRTGCAGRGLWRLPLLPCPRRPVACPRTSPFHVNGVARTWGKGKGRGGTTDGERCALVRPLPRERDSADRMKGRGRGRQGEEGRRCAIIHPFRRGQGKGVTGVTGRGWRCAVVRPPSAQMRRAIVRAPFPRECGSANRGGGGGWGEAAPACLHAPPFRANGAARIEGEGRGQGEWREGGACLRAHSTQTRRHGCKGGEGKGGQHALVRPHFLRAKGQRWRKGKGGRGGWATYPCAPPLGVLSGRWSMRGRGKGEGHQPTLLRPLFDANEVGEGGGRRVCTQEAKRACHRGAHNEMGGRTLPPLLFPTSTSALSAQKASARGPGPSLDRAAPYARKECSRGHAAPSRPLGRTAHTHGKGAHEHSTSPPIPPFPIRAEGVCTMRAAPPLRIVPGFSPPPPLVRRPPSALTLPPCPHHPVHAEWGRARASRWAARTGQEGKAPQSPSRAACSHRKGRMRANRPRLTTCCTGGPAVSLRSPVFTRHSTT
ncbi:hypothetical protein EDB83DRAFT_2313741 [Lactarius deliciosus]|nr:hypothetical protein EDB83DRAFT_2313741 [Lactarius deliciosus]